MRKFGVKSSNNITDNIGKVLKPLTHTFTDSVVILDHINSTIMNKSDQSILYRWLLK